MISASRAEAIARHRPHDAALRGKHVFALIGSGSSARGAAGARRDDELGERARIVRLHEVTAGKRRVPLAASPWNALPEDPIDTLV